MLGAGIFRRLVHVVDHRTPAITCHSTTVQFARCGAAVIALSDQTIHGWQRCSMCPAWGDTPCFLNVTPALVYSGLA